MTNLKDDFETVIGKDGKPKRVSSPKNGNMLDILQDGERVRVSFFDAMAARGEFTGARSQFTDMRITDADDTPLGLHRPGFRVAAGNQMHDAKRALADAYRAYDQERESAWVNPNSDVGAGESQFIGARENDLCTRDGYPGRLRYNDEGNLECVLDDPNGSTDRRTLDQKMEDHQLRMDEEYRAYARRKSEEWRGR